MFVTSFAGQDLHIIQHFEFAAANAVDGRATEKSRWVSAQEGEKWIALDLGAAQSIACARIVSGYNRGPGTAVKNAKLQAERDGKWADIPSASISGNRQTERVINFAAWTCPWAPALWPRT